MSNWSSWSHPTNPPPPTSYRWYGHACSEVILIAHLGSVKAEKPDTGAVGPGFYMYPAEEGGEGTYFILPGHDGRKMQVRATAWQPMPAFPDKILYWVEVTEKGEVKFTPPDGK